MDNKVLIAVVAVVVLAAAGGGAALLLNNGHNGTSDSSILNIDSPGTYTGGEYEKVIIGAGVGDGDVTLKGVKILKELIIRGGGSHSVTMEDSDASQARTSIEKEEGETPRVNLINSQLGETDVTGRAIIEGDANSKVQSVTADGASVTFQGENTKVEEVKATGNTSVNITGGSVTTVEAVSSTVTVSGQSTTVSSVKATENTTVSVTSGNVTNVDASGSTVNVAGENATIENLDLSGQSAVSVQNGTVDSMSMQKDSQVSLEVGADGTLQSVTYSDNVAVTTIGTNTEDKLAESDQKMAEGASTSDVSVNGQNQHVHRYTILINADWSTLDRANKTVTATVACEICDENADGHAVTKTVALREYVEQATCESGGYTVYFIISIPGHNGSPRYDDVPALGHDYEKTCTWNEGHGSATIKFVCRHDSTHTVEFVTQDVQTQITEPTCTEKGRTVYTVSGDRDGVSYEFTDTIESDALGHDFGPQQVDWSRLNTQRKTVQIVGYCSRDHNHKLVGEVPVTERVIEPTCTEGGYTVYFTDIPGDNGSPRYSETPALGHDYRAAYDWNPDHTVVHITFTCANDRSHIIELTTQDVQTQETPATCTESGSRTYSVSGVHDGLEYSDSVTVILQPLGHDFVLSEIQWNTLDEEALAVSALYTCLRNNEHTETRTLIVQKDVTEPTCTVAGRTHYYVANSGDNGHDVPIPALGHDLVHHDAKDATCTEKGWDAYDTCAREGCDYTTFHEREALGHDYQHHDAQAPTLESEGWQAYEECTRCHDSNKVTVPMLHGYTVTVYGGKVAKTGDEPTQSVIRVAENTVVHVSYDGEGDIYWTSNLADYIPGNTFSALVQSDLYYTPHPAEDKTYGEWTKTSATCSEDGLWYRASTDGQWREYLTIPAHGHVLDPDFTVTREPTCTEEGVGYYVCRICGEHVEESIECLGHDYDAIRLVQQPNGAQPGQMLYECAVCGHQVTKDYYVPVYLDADGTTVHLSWSEVSNNYAQSRANHRDEYHTTWTVDDNGTPRDAYLYTVKRYVDSAGSNDRDVTSWFLWVDHGAHTPVYVARVDGPTHNVYDSWAVAGYVDSRAEFIEFIDNLDLGVDNGKNASVLFDLYRMWTDRLNAGFTEGYQSESITFRGIPCTNYWNDYYSYIVDANNCCLSMTEGLGSYADVLQIRSIGEEEHLPFENGFVQEPFRNVGLMNGVNFYFGSIPTLATVSAFCVTLYDGTYVTDDYSSPSVGFYNADDLDLSMTWVRPNFRTPTTFTHIEVQGLNGQWYAIPTAEYTHDGFQGVYYGFDIGNGETLRALYQYMVQNHPDNFVMPNSPNFKGIFLRCAGTPIIADSTVTVIGGTVGGKTPGNNGYVVYGGETIYLYPTNVPGKDFDHWIITEEGRTVEQNTSSYTVPAGSDVTITATYADKPKHHVQFTAGTGGTVSAYDGDYYEGETISAIATPEPGYVLAGWYRDNEEWAWSSSRVLEIYAYGDVVFTARFELVDVENMNRITATNGFVQADGIGGKQTEVYADVNKGIQVLLWENPEVEEVIRWDMTYSAGTPGATFTMMYTDSEDRFYPQDVKYAGALTTVVGLFTEDIRTFTVTVDKCDGSQPVETEVMEGRDFQIPEAPEREGYNFLEWNSETDGTGTTYVPEYYITVEDDVTIHAVWEKKVTRLTISMGISSSFYTLSPTYVDIEYGTMYTIPSSLVSVHRGFAVTGWKYTTEEGVIVTVPADGTGQVPYGVTSMEAVCNFYEYTLQFNKNAGDATGAMQDKTFKVSDLETSGSLRAVRIDLPYGFVRIGYDLTSWKCSSDTLGQSAKSGYVLLDMLGLVNGSPNEGATFTLDAQWTGKSYTLYYKTNGINGVTLGSSSLKFKAGDPDVYLLSQFNVTSGYNTYYLLSWNTMADGSGTTFLGNTGTPVSDLIVCFGDAVTMNLYAQWGMTQYTVYFVNEERPNEPGSQDFTYGTANKALTRVEDLGEAFVKDGCTFQGWATEPDGPVVYTDGQKVSNLTTTGSISLYAVWEEDQ